MQVEGKQVLIGIMSDSHGRALPVRHALALFDGLGVEHVIHCGDVGDEDIFAEFAERPFTFVWGNTDLSTAGPIAYVLRTLNIQPPESIPRMLTLGGKRVAVFHGHERGFEAALDSLDVHYIFHGHTHEKRDERRGKVRIINPGALHRVRHKSVATLATETDVLTFHTILAP